MAFISTELYAFFSRSKNAYSNLVSSGDIHLISGLELKNLLGNITIVIKFGDGTISVI